MADLLAREKYLLKTRNYSLKPTATQSVYVLKPLIFCNICMEEYEPHQAYKIVHCECVYCLECTFEYLRYQIINGAYKITCPDAKCTRKGCFSLNEIVIIVTANFLSYGRKSVFLCSWKICPLSFSHFPHFSCYLLLILQKTLVTYRVMHI